VVLEVGSGVGEEVDHSTFLDEIVLLVESNVLHLFLGVGKVGHLLLLANVGPLGAELLHLVHGVHVVEDGELGAWEPEEVADLSPAEVEANHELVVEDHASDPLVVGPAAELGNGGDGSNVGEKEDKTTAGASKGLVVGGDVLGADSLEQGLNVVVVSVNEGRLLSMVGVDITGSHLGKFVLVVTLAVSLLVDGFLDLAGALVHLFATSDVSSFESITNAGGRESTGCARHDHSLEEGGCVASTAANFPRALFSFNSLAASA